MYGSFTLPNIMIRSPQERLLLAMLVLNLLSMLFLLTNHTPASERADAKQYSRDLTEKQTSVAEIKKSPSALKRSLKDNLPTSNDSLSGPVKLRAKNNSSEFRFDETQGQFDKLRRFKIHHFVIASDMWAASSSRKVCLATQTSLDRSSWLVNVSSTWKGPISVSLFTPDVEYDLAVRYIKFLRRCYPPIRDKVSFHFSYPVQYPPKFLPDGDGDNEVLCLDHVKVLKELLSKRPNTMMKWRESFAYPQNLLRNVARISCPQDYILCSDVDMIPTPQLDGELEEFLSRKEVEECNKCAYVIPVYEINATCDRIPVNKTQLLSLVEGKLARTFHVEVFKDNQKKSNLELWEKNGQSDAMNVSHDADKYAFYYEPIYVARAEVPMYDERFIGFGLTRNTQVYEMFLANYKFRVLNNAFLIHWGFQTVSARPQWRTNQSSFNSEVFREFVRDVAVKYDKDPLGLLWKYSGKLKKRLKITYSKNTRS